MSDIPKTELSVTFKNLTVGQAMVLQEMFQYWQHLGRLGGSRVVCMTVDGDGQFKPQVECQIACPPSEQPDVTQTMLELCFLDDGHGNREYLPEALGYYLKNPKDYAFAKKIHRAREAPQETQPQAR